MPRIPMTTQNVDSNEIAKFNDMATHWWDPEGDCKPLHQLNPLRLAFIQEQAELSDKKVLDIGCGGGILTEAMAKTGADVIGIDMSPDAIKVAKEHAQTLQDANISYELCTAEEMAEKHPQHFDVITCMEMLEHVPNPETIIQACATLIKPGGHIFFSTLNRNPKSYLYAIIGAEYILKMLPQGTHDYSKFIRPAELSAWLRKYNISLQLMKGISYNPLNKRYRLTEDVSVNYLVGCRVL